MRLDDRPKLRPPLRLFAAIVLLAATRVGAQARGEKDLLPMFFGLHSTTETSSSLSMTCEGDPPYTQLVCTFVSLSVRKPSAAETQRNLKELEEAIRNMSPREFLDNRQQQCGGTPEKHAAAIREVESMKARYPASASFAETLSALCRCNDLECYKQGLRKALELDQDVCEASADTFQVEFRRVGRDRKWMNKAEPSGLCSMVTAIVIEQRDGKWTYRQNRLAIDQTLPLCKELQPQQEQVFSEMLSPGITGCRVVRY